MLGEPSNNLVTVRKASTVTGLTEKAIRRKIEVGKWLRGCHYHVSPDNDIFIDLDAIRNWIRGKKGGNQ
ncbi:excisionase [Rubrivivax gelatinosus]|nr:excisionase [Rubrivivax gelatinosus]